MKRRTFVQTSLLAAAPAMGPVAETRYGKVRGIAADGVSVFRGIPYAKAARFEAPKPPDKWPSVRDATATGPRCVQGPGVIFLSPTIGEYFAGGHKNRVELAKQEDSEHCQNLNILTPGLRGKRPVMLYIHGGGFSGGSSLLTLYADRFPKEQDVVLVGVNHRINVFGYLYLGDRYPDAGNAGQLDLIAALQWVRDNIANFGGDPQNVTIFGESGGGAKISTLMAMPAAKGLFHRAIVESGSQMHIPLKDEAEKNARAVIDKIRLDRLTDASAKELFEAARQGFNSSPVVDGRSIPQQTWEPGAPAISAHVPMLIGNCKDESSLFSLREEALYSLDKKGLRERLVKDGIPEGEVDGLLTLYQRDHPRETPSDLWFRISTDRGARYQATLQAEKQIAAGKAPVYLYYFNWNTPLVDGKIRAFHTAELPLLMRLVLYPETEQLSKQLAGAWAAFARNGNPEHEGLKPWPRYTTEQRGTMIFNAKESRAVDDPDRDERIKLRPHPSGRLL